MGVSSRSLSFPQSPKFEIFYAENAIITPPGVTLAPGGVIQTGLFGNAILNWPTFGGEEPIGRTRVSACTRLALLRSTLSPKGGFKVFWRISQVPLCAKKAKVITTVRPKTNPDTEYRIELNGTSTRIKGTELIATAIDDKTTGIGMVDGVIEATAPNGQVVDVAAGESAISGPHGIEKFNTPPLAFDYTWGGAGNLRITFAKGLFAEVNGKPVESGQWVGGLGREVRVSVSDLADNRIDRVLVWPGWRPRNQRSN